MSARRTPPTLLRQAWGYCDCCTTMYGVGLHGLRRLGDRCNDLSLSRDFTDPCPGIIRDRKRPDMPEAICQTCQTIYPCAQVEQLNIWCGPRQCPTCHIGVIDPVAGRFPVARCQEAAP